MCGGVWMVSGGVWVVSGGVWMVSGWCLDGVSGSLGCMDIKYLLQNVIEGHETQI